VARSIYWVLFDERSRGLSTPMISSEPEAGQAYTRASVEAYLRAAAAERTRIESAIAAARSRTAWALGEEERLRSLAPAFDTPPGGTPVNGNSPAAVPESLVDRVPVNGEGNGRLWREPDLPTAAARD
jgi:hypothetical protein